MIFMAFGAHAQKMMFKQLADLSSSGNWRFCLQSKHEGMIVDFRYEKGIWAESMDEYWDASHIYFESLGTTGDSVDNKAVQAFRIIGDGWLRVRDGKATFKRIEDEEEVYPTWVLEPTGEEAWIRIKYVNEDKYLTLGRQNEGKYEVVVADKQVNGNDQQWRLLRVENK